jgi:hypothetical protein
VKTVILSYPNGVHREELLAGIPRKGDHLQLPNGRDYKDYIVEQVTFLPAQTGDPEPSVMLTIREYPT